MVDSSQALLDDAIDEILRREPLYLSRFPIGFSTIDAQLSRYQRDPVLCRHSPSEITQTLLEAIAYCIDRGVHLNETATDPVGDMLLDSAMTALDPAWEAASFKSSRSGGAGLMAALSDAYQEHRTETGSRYFLRHEGSQPLVLVNATGAPLSPWSQMIADHSHDFRILVVESRCTNLLTGGMTQYVDLNDDADDIARAMDREKLDHVAVVGWCSGGRMALHLAMRNASRVHSLALVSPSLWGIGGVEPRPTSFETGLGQVFSAVRSRPDSAQFFVKGIEQLVHPADWTKGTLDPAGRAAALFRLPAKDRARALVAAMLDAESLVNSARRDETDLAYPVHEAIQLLTMPLLLITGDHDNIIDNEYIASGLRKWSRNLTQARISGAGHYAQDLQYRYFLESIRQFLDGGQVTSCARVEVEQLVVSHAVEPANVRADR